MKRIYPFCMLICLGCNAINRPNPKAVISPKGYELDQPEKIKLHQSMDEISGMVYYEPMKCIIALNDEEGELYAVPLDNSRQYESWKFTRKGDFEDLAFTGTDWFALKSNGNIFKLAHCFTDSTSSMEFDFPRKGSNDFETLYFDGRKLVSICKSCKDDEKGLTSAYAFDITTLTFSDDPVFKLDANQGGMQTGKKNNSVKPSAAAIHPVTKELYIVASLNHSLLIADTSGKIKEAFELDSKIFKQPEGITFSPSGDLYISNEAKGGIANILKFAYKPAN